MKQTLPLSQKLYLLSIHPDKGGIVSASYTAIGYVLAGSILLELYQSGNIKFENKRVVVLNDKTDNEIHDFVLGKMKTVKSPRKISHWINRFAHFKKTIFNGIGSDLSEKRLIRMQDKRFLFIKWKSPVILNKSVVYHLIDHLKEIIFKGSTDESDLILLSFVLPAKLHFRLYKDRLKRKEAVKKLKSILLDNPVSNPVKEAIEAAESVAAAIAVTTALSASN